MLRAIISDLHANLEAFEAVLRDLEARGAESIVCLGDVIGYGPQPRELLARAFGFEVTLLGNHEEAAMYYAEDFNGPARQALDWTRDQINSKEHTPQENSRLWAFLGEMPTEVHLENAHLVHGSPRDPVREYMLPRDSNDAEKMTGVFEKVVGDVCFVGHSHVPGVYTEHPGFLSPARVPEGYRLNGGKALVNVGSVGQPRDGDPRASYVTFDGETVWFHRVEYDYRATQKKILETGALPRYLARRLQDGR